MAISVKLVFVHQGFKTCSGCYGVIRLLNVIPEPYTIRAARIHLARVLDLLRAPGPQDALRDGCSPSVLETITYTQTTGIHI